jgi:hypothetical protein
MTPTFIENLKIQFSNKLGFNEVDINVFQLFLPIFHEDGDPVEIFVEVIDESNLKIKDFGLTVMKLSYIFEIDTDNKKRLLNKIVSEGRCVLEDDVLVLNSSTYRLYQDILRFNQVITRILNLKLFTKNNVASLFYEMLENTIFSKYLRYKPEKDFYPIVGKEEYKVDYKLTDSRIGEIPFFLFGVNSDKSALYATTALQQFKLEKKNFINITILDGSTSLSKKTENLITNASDKMFTSLDAFSSDGEAEIERRIFLKA